MKKYFYKTELHGDDYLIVESPYKISEDTATFGGTIVLITGDTLQVAKAGQHSNNWLAEEFTPITEDETNRLIEFHKSPKTQSRTFILQSARDYDMSFEDVKTIFEKNIHQEDFYNALESFIKERSEN